MQKVDLHIHTENSDGFYSTLEILNRSEELGLSIISITDHDTVQSYFDMIKQKLRFNGCIITGVELSFSQDGRIFDMLGYGINLKLMNDWLNEYYNQDKKIAHQKMILNTMKNLYLKLGIKFDNNITILNGKKSEAYNLMKGSAKDFEENRAIAPEIWEENFYKKHHTNPRSKFFVDETGIHPPISKVIDIIHKSNGIASLAHCGAYGMNDEEMYKYIEFAVQNGIDAIELKHSSHTQKTEDIIKKFAKKHNLLLTGGSDFHGGRIKPNVNLGKAYDDQFIDANKLENFLKRLEILQSKI